MAKKKRKSNEGEDTPAPKPAPKMAVSMRGLLSEVKLELPSKTPATPASPPPAPAKPMTKIAAPASLPSAVERRPSEMARGDERIAFLDALRGVTPLSGRAPTRIGAAHTTPATPPRIEIQKSDAEARQRLIDLAVGGVKFDIQREEDWIEGVRQGASPTLLKTLRKSPISKDRTLDLHGSRAAEAEARLQRFLREARSAGIRRVAIIQGRGLHSEGGRSVLTDVVLRVLTEGPAALFVLAFTTPPLREGGAGALYVELELAR